VRADEARSADRITRAISISLAIVFYWFGIQKFFPGVSPAEGIAASTIDLVPGELLRPRVGVFLLACWEIALGVAILIFPRSRLILFSAAAHLCLTFVPFLIFPDQTFGSATGSLTLLGQYLVKNLVLLAGLFTLAELQRGSSRQPSASAEPAVAGFSRKPARAAAVAPAEGNWQPAPAGGRWEEAEVTAGWERATAASTRVEAEGEWDDRRGPWHGGSPGWEPEPSAAPASATWDTGFELPPWTEHHEPWIEGELPWDAGEPFWRDDSHAPRGARDNQAADFESWSAAVGDDDLGRLARSRRRG
jgi:hypothetical protein